MSNRESNKRNIQKDKKNTERDTVSVKKAKTLKNSDEYLGDKTLDEVKKNV